MNVQIDNAFVMRATVSQLQAVASIIGMSEAQVQKALSKGKLAAVVGTKLANDPTYSAAFAACTLTMDIPEPNQAEAAAAEAAAAAAAERDQRRQARAAKEAEAKAAAAAAAERDQRRQARAAKEAEAKAAAAAAKEAKADEAPPAGKRAATKSAKDWLRDLLSAEGASYTLAELVALSGKTEINIRTMLSDLRSPRYCGKAGVFATKSVRTGGKTYYSKA